MTKYSRTSTGKYSVNGKVYEQLIGTRAQVWHGTAYKTSGGLSHDKLMKNKSGRIVSRSKHSTAKKQNRLGKAGYVPKKGKFVLFKKHTAKKGRGSRRMRGGMALGGPLSPKSYSGSGATSGVALQFIAGNAA